MKESQSQTKTKTLLGDQKCAEIRRPSNQKHVRSTGLWLLALGLCLATSGAPRIHAATKIVNRIVARVNNDIITSRQFDRKQQELRETLAQRYSGSELEAQYHEQSTNLLRTLIDEDLMVQKAKDLDINVETDVVKQLDQIREENHFASQLDLEKAVEAEGLIWEDFQDQIRRRLLMQQVIEREVGSRITPTRAEARAFFEAHKEEFTSPAGMRLAEILISNDKRKPAETQQRAQDALEELKGGTKWEDVVKKYSDNTEGGPIGDIGFFKEGTMAPAVAAAVAKLEVNDYSGVVSTQYGDIILRVLEIRTGGVPKFEEVEQRVTGALYDEKIQNQQRAYMSQLRRDSYIFIAPGYVDTGAVKSDNAAAAEFNE
ncbi:MAG TPA: peptidyl-prolyl cis-trans isomerase [Terriglobia bacterium]